MPSKKKDRDEQDEKDLASRKNILQAEVDSRVVFLTGSIDKDSANKTMRALLVLDEMENAPIKLFINSPGGEVNSGFAIFDCLRFLRSKVYVIGSGLVASAAALIYAAVPRDRRFSLPHSRYLLHQPLSGVQGVVTDLEIYSKEISDLKLLLNSILAKATGQDQAKIERDTDRDFWLNATAARDYGLVGKIVENKQEIDELFPSPKPHKKTEKEDGDSKRKDASAASQKTSKQTNKPAANASKGGAKASGAPAKKSAEKSSGKVAKKPAKKSGSKTSKK